MNFQSRCVFWLNLLARVAGQPKTAIFAIVLLLTTVCLLTGVHPAYAEHVTGG